jgi:hypothetical protein
MKSIYVIEAVNGTQLAEFMGMTDFTMNGGKAPQTSRCCTFEGVQGQRPAGVATRGSRANGAHIVRDMRTVL